MTKQWVVPPARLYSRCSPEDLPFETTADLEDLEEIIGQARALDAVHFGIGIQQSGYNIFALGPTGIGKQSTVTRLLEQKALQQPPPSDWVYVNNFSQPHKPRALRLPNGYGVKLESDMQHLVDELRVAVPAAFESEEYRNQVHEIEQALKDEQDKALEEVRSSAGEDNIALIRTPGGFAFAPIKDNEVLSPEDYEKLPTEEREKLEKKIEVLQDKLRNVIRQIPAWRSKSREKLKKLNQEIAASSVGFHIESLREAYKALPEVVEYLENVEKDIVDNVEDFRGREDEAESLFKIGGDRSSPFSRYEVNVLVDHTDAKGAPVIYEDHPTYMNLVGRVEHIAMMGALITDFRLIKSGALHRANHGYLILDALKVLQHPYAWEGLKRALTSREIRIQSLEQMLSLASTVSLDPESIPLDIKVVLTGDRIFYYLLYQLDHEFAELFKVAADFEETMDRHPENVGLYSRLIATLARRHTLRPFDAGAVARLIEESARYADDAHKISTHMRNLSDLLCEADYWASEHGNGAVTTKDVQMAINKRKYRSNRMHERILEAIVRGTILIDTEKERVGTINGLSVMELGDVRFGSPTRITASVRLGEGEVMDIEREVELGGPIHSKGVMILSSFLGARYGKKRPLSLNASLVFEQSYGEIEGDSASSTELYALLSALADVPVKQSLAVTGSVNQHGEVQAIGGVNEKIEGFFDLCVQRGLRGEEGVLVPASNVQHLMLRDDVVEAVEQGKFTIYAVDTIDHGIEILTGIPAGEPDKEDNYPEGTINYMVDQRLKHFTDIRHEFIAKSKEMEDDSSEEKDNNPEEDSGPQ
jgi:lon-related putative ATP-dependent protease